MDLNHAMELEELTAQLAYSTNRYIHLQNEMSNTQNLLMDENKKLKEDINKLRDRYDRLMDSHKKLQKNNHMLECSLIDAVEKISEDKRQLEDDIKLLTCQLLETKNIVYELTEKMNLSNVQDGIKSCTSLNNPKNISTLTSQQQLRFPISTFPPTAICYSSSESKLDKLVDETNEKTLISKVTGLIKSNSIPLKQDRVFVCGKCLCKILITENSTQTVDSCYDNKKNKMKVHHI